MSTLTEKAIEGTARMFDAAMSPERVRARRLEVLAAIRESDRIAEAGRLTEEWMNGFYLGRGTEPGPREIATVAIGFYKELGEVQP